MAAFEAYLSPVPQQHQHQSIHRARHGAGDDHIFVHPAEPAIGEPGWGLLIPAACVSAVVGYFSIRLLMRVLAGPKFWYFGFYCLAAGLLTVCLSCLPQ